MNASFGQMSFLPLPHSLEPYKETHEPRINPFFAPHHTGIPAKFLFFSQAHATETNLSNQHLGERLKMSGNFSSGGEGK